MGQNHLLYLLMLQLNLMKGVGGNFDGSTRNSLCHSRFLLLLQDSGIELRVPEDYFCMLASFLIDISAVAGPVLRVGLHMATGEGGSCGSSSPGSEVLIPSEVQKQSFSGHVRHPESFSFLTRARDSRPRGMSCCHYLDFDKMT